MGSICQNLQPDCKRILRTKRKKQKPWISPVSWNKFEERKQLKLKTDSTKFNRIKQLTQKEYRDKNKEVKKGVRKGKRQWIDNLPSDAQRAAENRQMKSLYAMTNHVMQSVSKTNKETLLPVMREEKNGGKSTLKRY